jgi:hypothetical protein
MSWLGDIFSAQPKQFRYTLSTDGQTYVLPNAPIGWEENIIRWSRSEFYYGMIRSFSVPLQFVLDGAWILRTGFYTYGLRGEATLLIEELNLQTWGYETIFSGDIDFSTFSDKDTEVTVTAMEAGISAMIKAYENIKYTIPIDVAEAVDIELTPLKLRETAQFIFTPTVDRYLKAILGLNLIINEPQALGDLSAYNVDFFNVNENPPIPLDSDWDNRFFYKAKIDTEIRIQGNISGSFRGGTGNNSFTVSIYKYEAGISGGAGSYLMTLAQEAINGTGTVAFDVDFDETFDLLEGDILYMITTQVPIGDGGVVTSAGTVIDDGELNLSYFTGSPATFCKALRAEYVFQALLNKMNQGVAVPAQSFLLNQWYELCITSGQAIRRIDNPVLIISFRDFFISINAVLNAGFGIENGKAVLESKSYFFKSTLQAANVGENKEFNLEIYEPYIYNSIKIGYPDPKFSTIIDNNDEVNSTQVYSNPITRVQKELDLVSVIRADAYGIEDTRITPAGSANTNNDNDSFFIKIKAQPEPGIVEYYRPERSEGYISLTGVLAAETFYNWDLSPKRNLLRHGDFLRSMLYNYDQFFINFESALKNSQMVVVDISGSRVAESSSVKIGTLADRIFIPYLISILTKLPKNAMQMVDINPTGYIRSEFNESTQDGFMIDISVDVSKNRQRELKLLLTPFNQLGNLIR